MNLTLEPRQAGSHLVLISSFCATKSKEAKEKPSQLDPNLLAQGR